MGFIDKKGERALYVDPGVNDNINFEDVNLDYVVKSEFIHFSSFIGRRPFETQKKLIGQLSNIQITFDPGIFYARKGLNAIKPILKKSHVIFPNKVETKLLTGHGYKEGAKTFIQLGVDIVVVKLGKNGCYVTDGKEDFLVEAYNVNVVDTTGAGDAFCAGFIYGLIKKKDLYECARIGNFVASRCVTKIGARTGLPKHEDLRDF
jgi:ribokinase